METPFVVVGRVWWIRLAQGTMYYMDGLDPVTVIGSFFLGGGWHNVTYKENAASDMQKRLN